MVEDGIYNKPSAEEENIIALQAQVQKLVKNNKKQKAEGTTNNTTNKDGKKASGKDKDKKENQNR